MEQQTGWWFQPVVPNRKRSTSRLLMRRKMVLANSLVIPQKLKIESSYDLAIQLQRKKYV